MELAHLEVVQYGTAIIECDKYVLIKELVNFDDVKECCEAIYNAMQPYFPIEINEVHRNGLYIIYKDIPILVYGREHLSNETVQIGLKCTGLLKLT